jgi:hypothetical protein
LILVGLRQKNGGEQVRQVPASSGIIIENGNMPPDCFQDNHMAGQDKMVAFFTSLNTLFLKFKCNAWRKCEAVADWCVASNNLG